jgi:hypothetical protein
MAARLWRLRLALPLLLSWGGCGPVDESAVEPGLTRQEEQQQSDNGLSLNGLSLNGLSLNGLSLNGLSLNGLSTSAFSAWFQADTAQANAVMRYVVLCAVPAGQSRTYTDSVTGQTYTWNGALGVAPDWASGQPATVLEQQLVSACLAAHVNKYGLNIQLSVLGRTAKNRLIPYTSSELSEYSHKEACFFGNLFTSEGIYVGNDRGNLNARQSTARACTLSSNADGTRTTNCAPLVYAGSCTSYCTLDASKTYYTVCNYNGVTYRPITTRLRAEDIYYCGDGVCQMTESCGTSNQYYNCALDCGACP